MKQKANKPGAPRRLPEDGVVLFLRGVAPDVIRYLDRLAEQERAARPGRSVSRSDIARDILLHAVGRGAA